MNKCSQCEKEFKSIYALSAHKRVHLPNYSEIKEKAISNSIKTNRLQRKQRIDDYNLSPKYCEYCNEVLSYEDRLKTYCNSSCSAKASNSSREFTPKDDKRTKEGQCTKCNIPLEVNIRTDLSKIVCEGCKANNQPGYYKQFIKYKKCCVCGKEIEKNNKFDYCREHWILSEEFQKTIAHGNKNYKKGYVYNKWSDSYVYLLSGLEFKYYSYLTENNIKWDKPNPLKYTIENESHLYFPDFYLPDTDEYIEVKGYMWNNDKEKMRLVTEQNQDKNIRILKAKDINRLI